MQYLSHIFFLFGILTIACALAPSPEEGCCNPPCEQEEKCCCYDDQGNSPCGLPLPRTTSLWTLGRVPKNECVCVPDSKFVECDSDEGCNSGICCCEDEPGTRSPKQPSDCIRPKPPNKDAVFGSKPFNKCFCVPDTGNECGPPESCGPEKECCCNPPRSELVCSDEKWASAVKTLRPDSCGCVGP